MSLKFTLLSICIVAASVAYSQSDTIIMKSGEQYIGKISADTKDYIQLIIGQSSHILQKKYIEKIISGKTGALSFSKVIQVEGINKKEIYNRARHWFAETYKNSKRVLQIDNFEQDGSLIGNGSYDYNTTTGMILKGVFSFGHVNYLVKIFIKEGRYKIIVTDFIHESTEHENIEYGLLTYDYVCTSTSGNNKKLIAERWKELKNNAEEYAFLLIADAERFISKPLESETDDW